MTKSRPIIVTAQMARADQKWANRLRQEYFPPERNFLDAHITLFHHLPPQHWDEISARIKQQTAEYAPPRAMLSGVMMLGRGVALRVESDELSVMREQLASAFHGLLIPQDMNKPRFHITVQNKVSGSEAKTLYAKLMEDFEPRPLEIIGLSAYYYMGGPWEEIDHYKFRGAVNAANY